MKQLIAIQETLWIIGGYLLAHALVDRPEDWRLWAALVCMFGIIIISIWMQ